MGLQCGPILEDKHLIDVLKVGVGTFLNGGGGRCNSSHVDMVVMKLVLHFIRTCTR